MRLGLFATVYGHLSTEEVLKKVSGLGLDRIELGAGGWPGSPHLPVDTLLESRERAQEQRKQIEAYGCQISALSCHCNPLHPDPQTATAHHEELRKAILLAERLGVETVVTFSGCPGDRGQSLTPNWVTTPWPPEFATLLEWQWEQVAIPYWRDTSTFAASHGVRIALEAHPGFLVYNVETLQRLRSATSARIGINFDPSHLYWQGVHIPSAIAALGPAIFHVHAKDVALSRQNVDRNGVIDTKSYAKVQDRSWNFRTIGFGHGELEWRETLSALRMAGYDGTVSIEHEDPLASVDEGVGMAVDLLKRIILREPAAEAWWL